MPREKFNNSLEDALKIYWTDYAGWGRATRSEYWWSYLFYQILITSILANSMGPDIIWAAATLVPGFCVTARRLHDTGRSNWNALWALLPIIGWIVLIVYLCQPGQSKSNKWGKPRI